MRGRILSLVALAVGIGFFGASLPSGSLPQQVIAFFAVILLIGAGVLWLQERRRDPYDLGLLKEIHDRKEIEEIEREEEDFDYGSIVCPHCQTVRDKRIPACPNCGRSF